MNQVAKNHPQKVNTMQHIPNMKEKRVFPPELVGRNKACFDYFFNYLEERNIYYVKSSRLI